MHALLHTPMQHSAENAVEQSWGNWQKGEVFPMIGNTLYAQAAYLADMVASVVLIPFALIGVAFGSFQAIFLCSVEKADFLKETYDLLLVKARRFFASALGVVSPGSAHYFEHRSILPMATGLIVTAATSYMVLHYQPPRGDLLEKFKSFWSN